MPTQAFLYLIVDGQKCLWGCEKAAEITVYSLSSTTYKMPIFDFEKS
jgi:hypothetical protein